MKLLLVDDLEADRFTLGALLSGDGHEVVEAACCAEARARLWAAPPKWCSSTWAFPTATGAP